MSRNNYSNIIPQKNQQAVMRTSFQTSIELKNIKSNLMWIKINNHS